MDEYESSAQDVVSGTTTSSGRGFPAACAPEGSESRGRAFDARSRAHAAVDTAEICGVAGRRVYQGQERDSFGPGLWRAQTQFRRAAFLGSRILRQHGWSRRGRDPRLHPQPREGRSEARTDESLVLTHATFRWRQTQGGASASPPTALSGPNPKAPGFAGGYLQLRSSRSKKAIYQRCQIAILLYRSSRSPLFTQETRPASIFAHASDCK
jgi:hypothetical protein